jgi:recombinational DNA repair ATPase RecF
MNLVYESREDKSLSHANADRGYLMIKNVDIQNYRCFSKAHLSDCRRIDVIVGRNASGKTALLEVLFMVAGSSPELAVRLKTWRGQSIAISTEQHVYEA